MRNKRSVQFSQFSSLLAVCLQIPIVSKPTLLVIVVVGVVIFVPFDVVIVIDLRHVVIV